MLSVPNIGMLPEPMWKLIDSPISCACAQKRSQCASDSGGRPKSSIRPGNTTPLCPRVAERSISTIVASRSQNGTVSNGMYRVRRGRLPVDEEVVVRLHALEHELRVGLHADVLVDLEHADVRIEHLRGDAELVHVREPSDGVVVAIVGVGDAVRVIGRELVPPRRRSRGPAA